MSPPSTPASVGMSPLQAEATLLVLLVVLAHALVWEFMTDDAFADLPRGGAVATVG